MLYRVGSLDFAGGNVVHLSSGVAGLWASVILGKRQGFGEEIFDPHNILLCCVGACLLWVGWAGFNAGAAVSAGYSAGYSLLVTQISASSGALTWMFAESAVRGKPR
jgi:Amt family ammonium transporter